jgi:hypothetical protein
MVPESMEIYTEGRGVRQDVKFSVDLLERIEGIGGVGETRWLSCAGEKWGCAPQVQHEPRQEQKVASQPATLFLYSALRS